MIEPNLSHLQEIHVYCFCQIGGVTGVVQFSALQSVLYDDDRLNVDIPSITSDYILKDFEDASPRLNPSFHKP